MSLLHALLLDLPQIDVYIAVRGDSQSSFVHFGYPNQKLRRGPLGGSTLLNHIQALIILGIVYFSPSLEAAQVRFDRHHIIFAVPEEYQTNQAITRSNLPFNNFGPEPFFTRVPSRYQQVYSASAFHRVPLGGGFITRIEFRGGCFGANTIVFSNAQPFSIRMSTTTRAPDGLSARFSENIGSDEITVVTNQFIFIRGDYGPCDSPHVDPSPDWSSTIQLGTPFYYDPALGNLLIEMQVPIGKLEEVGYVTTRKLVNEIASKTNDAVSRIVAAGLTNAVADIVDTSGLVTQFWFADFPKLSIVKTNSFLSGTTNEYLRVSWPTDPSPARLEYTESLSATPQWKAYGPPDYAQQTLSFIEIPIIDLKRPRYFRLFWNSPQPGIVQP